MDLFDQIPLAEDSYQAPNLAALGGQRPMAGTMTPDQMRQQNQQQMLVQALRQQQQPTAPAQAGRVTSTGSATQGMNASAIGGALGGMFGGGGNPAPADLAGTAFI